MLPSNLSWRVEGRPQLPMSVLLLGGYLSVLEGRLTNHAVVDEKVATR
jgi:hypothetical protein